MVFGCRRSFALSALLIAVLASAVKSEEIVDDPNNAVEGIYSECVMGLSWTCLQRKSLMFIDRMGKAEKFPLVGDGIVSLIRTGPAEPEMEEESLRGLDSNALGDVMDNAIYKFFQNHIFRFELPTWMQGPEEKQRSDNAIDFFVGENEEEGRKKGGGGHGGHGGGHGGGKMKGMKKMMMMMCMMGAGKLMMLGPMMMGLTKMMAMKALLMGLISLIMSKIMILKKLKSQQGSSSGGWSSGGGGGGGGWSAGGNGGGAGGWSSGGGGGGGGGWDRSFGAHDLAYKGHIDNNA